ncbi:hypothetical protein KW850_24850 [Bacillus sp. sid0103]|uniref:hypothetical protein n=1 Tax=Bacillus sp. sid0103 TaxID=2856337 RepID=UPI001C486642|nr:hypothetical protein [Bacillus sp. sid0103]MBV7508449.1 hypothetical protein [Bacillus sp. sid0103]
MGLDMYLFSLPKITGMSYDEIVKASAEMGKHKAEQDEIYEKLKPHIKHFKEYDSSWSSIYEEVAYWRKANQIHNWFVENLHNGEDEPCFSQEVTKENLQDLNNLCLQVLQQKEPPINFLPTRPGCFFGNLSYDSYYYREIEETQELLAALIKNFNFETHYLLYQCSW